MLTQATHTYVVGCIRIYIVHVYMLDTYVYDTILYYICTYIIRTRISYVPLDPTIRKCKRASRVASKRASRVAGQGGSTPTLRIVVLLSALSRTYTQAFSFFLVDRPGVPVRCLFSKFGEMHVLYSIQIGARRCF